MNKLIAHLITHQCLELDFCVEATIRSMMDLCDEVYINDGNSTDGTLDIINSLKVEYGKDRLKLFVKDWNHTRRMWADEKNFLLDKIPNDVYVLCIDADEVIHENDIPLVRKAMLNGVDTLSFKMLHFYGRPTHYIKGSNWYSRHTRLWKRSTGIRLVHRPGGCADDLLWPDGRPAHLSGCIKSEAVIYHYGNCRSPEAMGRKSKKADDLYQNSDSYKDGTLAESRAFSYAFDKVGAHLFEGSHPKYIRDWYLSHKDQPTDFKIFNEKPNKLWCFEE